MNKTSNKGPTSFMNQGTFQNLYVSGLPPNVTDEHLQKIFSPFGTIQSAKVMLHVSTGLSRGFAFVLFASVEEGCSAFGALSGHEVTIDTTIFKLILMPSSHDGKKAILENKCIFVRNIPLQVSNEMVREFFSRFGIVTGYTSRSSTNQKTRRGGGASTEGDTSTRQASVEYDTIVAARDAILGTHNKRIFLECEVPILSKFSDSRESAKENKTKSQPPVPLPTSMLFTPSFSMPPLQSSVFPFPNPLPTPLLFNPTPYMPLPSRLSGLQHIFFEGVLARTVEGQLLPVRVDRCFDVEVLGGAHQQPQMVFLPSNTHLLQSGGGWPLGDSTFNCDSASH